MWWYETRCTAQAALCSSEWPERAIGKRLSPPTRDWIGGVENTMEGGEGPVTKYYDVDVMVTAEGACIRLLPLGGIEYLGKG